MTDQDCLFCGIAGGEQPAEFVYQDDLLVVFKDIFPRAPVHLLIVPREHIVSAHHLTDDDAELVARCYQTARRVAAEAGIEEGYRVTTNIGAGGGQAVFHLHFHVIGGKQLGHIDGG